MAYIPSSGSVIAFQSDPDKLQASVTGVVGVRGNPSVSGTVNIGNFPTTQNVSGSVAAWFRSSDASVITVGTPVANQSVSGTVQTDVRGSVAVAIISGSIATTTGNSSVQVLNFPVTQNVSGSVVASQGTSPWLTVPTSGSVIANQGGTQTTSLVSTVPSSVIVGTSIFGQLPAGTAPLGSVAVLQGTNPWIVNFANSSIIAINAGSVIAIPAGSVITVSQAPSIVGTYAEDAAHTSADKGLFTLGVRNDTVASFAGANLEYSPIGTDSAGRTLTKPFAAEESRVEGYASLVSTSVTTLVAAAGAGLKNYITDVWIANTGATTTLITFKDGAGSVLGYTIAPAGGGSNLPGLQTPIRTGANTSFDFQPTSASSILYATVKGFKAP